MPNHIPDSDHTDSDHTPYLVSLAKLREGVTAMFCKHTDKYLSSMPTTSLSQHGKYLAISEMDIVKFCSVSLDYTVALEGES